MFPSQHTPKRAKSSSVVHELVQALERYPSSHPCTCKRWARGETPPFGGATCPCTNKLLVTARTAREMSPIEKARFICRAEAVALGFDSSYKGPPLSELLHASWPALNNPYKPSPILLAQELLFRHKLQYIPAGQREKSSVRNELFSTLVTKKPQVVDAKSGAMMVARLLAVSDMIEFAFRNVGAHIVQFLSFEENGELLAAVKGHVLHETMCQLPFVVAQVQDEIARLWAKRQVNEIRLHQDTNLHIYQEEMREFIQEIDARIAAGVESEDAVFMSLTLEYDRQNAELERKSAALWSQPRTFAQLRLRLVEVGATEEYIGFLVGRAVRARHSTRVGADIVGEEFEVMATAGPSELLRRALRSRGFGRGVEMEARIERLPELTAGYRPGRTLMLATELAKQLIP